MFTSNYSVIVDIEKFQKIPTMVLLHILQYLDDNDGLFIVKYDKNTKGLCVSINANYPVITKSLIHKQIHTPIPDISYCRRFTDNHYRDYETITHKRFLLRVPKLGTINEQIRYNDDNNIIWHQCTFHKKKRARRSYSSTIVPRRYRITHDL
jgi:hypothetical protein